MCGVLVPFLGFRDVRHIRSCRDVGGSDEGLMSFILGLKGISGSLKVFSLGVASAVLNMLFTASVVTASVAASEQHSMSRGHKWHGAR